MESSGAYVMLKSLSAGIGYHINPYRLDVLVMDDQPRLQAIAADARKSAVGSGQSAVRGQSQGALG